MPMVNPLVLLRLELGGRREDMPVAQRGLAYDAMVFVAITWRTQRLSLRGQSESMPGAESWTLLPIPSQLEVIRRNAQQRLLPS